MENPHTVDHESPSDALDCADSARKRPRLDNGTAGKHTMPAGPVSVPALASPPQDQLEFTIRSQPPSSSQPSDPSDPALPSPPGEPAMDVPESPLPVVDDADSLDSPPVQVICIDDDDDAADAMPGYATTFVHTEPTAEFYFDTFPYANEQGDAQHALKLMVTHVSGTTNNFEPALLPQLAPWLHDLPSSRSSWDAVYESRQAFWTDFGSFVYKILARKHKFGDGFAQLGQSVRTIVSDFLGGYVILCARFLQIDAAVLAQPSSAPFTEQDLLSYKHIKNLSFIVGKSCHVFPLLAADHRVDTRVLVNRLVRDFAAGPAAGIKHLFALADAGLMNVTPSTQIHIASWTANILQSLGWYVQDGDLVDQSHFLHDVLRFFRTYDAELQDPAKVADVSGARDLLNQFANLVKAMCMWDAETARQLATDLLPLSRPGSPTTPGNERPETMISPYSQSLEHRPLLVSNAWKFKLLRKYVMKGRMELRVAGISAMNDSLVDVWREYHSSPQGCKNHPVMQYLAEFLLHEQVIDYIISVDSHPQLISRSGNIVGFLVVTYRYTKAQSDAIWQTISSSQDPRVVNALMTMLRHIITLMQQTDLLYFFSKLYTLPIESYSMDMMRFLWETYEKVVQSGYLDWGTVDHTERPWNVCIRIMQDTPLSKESSPLAVNLHREACNRLMQMASSIGWEERKQLSVECASHIEKRTEKATGSIRALHILTVKASPSHDGFFRQHPEITRHILEELCSFVETENHNAPYPLYQDALEYRLEILRVLIMRASDVIPSDLQSDILDHTIGKFALDSNTRDRAWVKFTDCTKYRPVSGFCTELISSYVPKLEPRYFTQGLYEFVASYDFPTTREVVTTKEGDKELLQIRGADLLWRLVLTAPEGTIEDQVAELLASRYVEVNAKHGVTLEEVEDTHAALVEKCTHELLSEYKTLRNRLANSPSVEAGECMDLLISDSARQQTKLRFSRTVLFETRLLKTIRTRPEFRRTPISDMDVQASEPDNNLGDTITVLYGTGSPTKHALLIGNENTVQDLEMRLCGVTGLTKVNMFYAGRKLNVPERLPQTLVGLELGSSPYVLVQRASGSQTLQPPCDYGPGRSVFETTVLDHFEELFACMDSDDYISNVLYDFFCSLPFHQRIPDEVASGTAATDFLFPPGKPFQAKYAALALQQRLNEQLRLGTLDETFLLNTIQLLDKALLDTNLLSDSFAGNHELSLASVLVGIMLEFLKERPHKDVSSRYFSNEVALVDRLVQIVCAALKMGPNNHLAVLHSYAAILEASLHSRTVWERFTNRKDIVELHQQLLLSNPRKGLRERIAKSIASVCVGDLPATSPLTKEDTTARFWTIVSAVLPEAVHYPTQSEQLFDIAEQVFRSHDEVSRDESSLRRCLVSWSDSLLGYRHEEFVGRDEVDFVVLGFTKLLLACIPSLKSFKKSLNAGELIEHIWRKFLFVPRIVDTENETRGQEQPVLESNTREELYHLLLALADDRISYGTLLDMAETLYDDEERMSNMINYGYDRSDQIRSRAGYVGLMNPRAICYMNSLMTQLFMNTNFRKFMLGLNIAEPNGSQRLLSQTQALFAQLQNSYRKSVDPRDFAICVKAVEGGPIDVNIQMDADEFYNLLFDQWEGQMLSQETKQQFRSFYGGQTVNQIKSKECEHVSERVESFFVVQCDVQGKQNLEESLQSFVEGDVMEGDNKYRCESCGGKYVDAVKRTCLKDVPDNLIFHLKRFDFDLVEMRRAKINDHFGFPERIDMSQYNVECLSDPSKPRQEDIFELVGVLVHQGTSENGHYYSHIRERPSPSGSTTHWVEFNDREVEGFDHTTIPFHAFGGQFDDQPGNQKNFSAYMVFYQRKEAIEKDRQEYITSAPSGWANVPVPDNLEAHIKEDNDMFLREYCLHDPNHSKFVKQILTSLRRVNNGTCSESHKQETRAIQVVLEHLCQSIVRQRSIDHFEETVGQLRKTVLSCATCCHITLTWLAAHDSALNGLLLRCTHTKARSQARTFLVESLFYLQSQDQTLYYGAEIADADSEMGLASPVQGVFAQVMERIRTVLSECSNYPRGWDDFFQTLCQIGSLGRFEVGVMLSSGILEFCLEALCIHADSQLQQHDPDLHRLLDKKKGLLNKVVELVYILLSHTDIRLPRCQTGSNRLAHQTNGKFHLSTLEAQCLTFWDSHNCALAFLDKVLDSYEPTKADKFYPGLILKLVLQSQSVRFQQRLCTTVKEGIIQFTPPWSDSYVQAVIPYCEAARDASSIPMLIDALAICAMKHREASASGEALIEAICAFPNIHNDTINQAVFPYWAMKHARVYAIPLLTHNNEDVRKSAAEHIEELFARSDVDDPDYIQLKFHVMRALIHDMKKRIITAHETGASRAFMEHLIMACEVLGTQLAEMAESENPDLTPWKHEDDLTLVQAVSQALELALSDWPENDTPLSNEGESLRLSREGGPFAEAGADFFDEDGFDNSDYASESDEAVELDVEGD